MNGNILTELLINMAILMISCCGINVTCLPLAFFQKAIKQHGIPEKVVIDKSGSNARQL